VLSNMRGQGGANASFENVNHVAPIVQQN
jgi:hypothetical protein